MKRSMTLALLCLAAAAVFASGTEEPGPDGWYEVPRLREFEGVELRTAADLTLSPGGECRVRVRGDRRDIEDLDIYVSGEDLVVRRESLFDFRPSTTSLEIEVTLPRLSRAVITSSGSFRGEGRFECRDLEMQVTGSGDLFIEAIADALECKTTGSGDIAYRGRADSLDLKCTGSGNADMEVRANLAEVVVTGSGSASLRGGADRMDVRVTGNGKLLAGDFSVREADITLTGSGDAEVRVSGTLDARVTGSGSVLYSGNPEHLNFQGGGSGKIEKR